MRITLGSTELAQLQKTLETILTPIETSSPDAWGKAVMEDVKNLLNADQAFFALPLDGSVHVIGTGDRTADAARAYETDYWRCDFVLGKRRKELGLEVHQQHQLYRPGETRHDILFNEWCVPNKLFDTLGMAVEVCGGPIPAGVNVYHDRRSGTSFGQRGRALMSLLLPAFKASVLSYSALVRVRESMATMIDSLRDGACLVSESGVIIHQNESLQRFFSVEDEPQLLRAAIDHAARSLTTLHTPRGNEDSANCRHVFQHVQTATNLYEVRAIRVTQEAARCDVAGIIFVEGLSSIEVSRRNVALCLKRQFRLTSRELEVALLLARRFSTNEIATRLGISPHTARHHTEKVLEKTGLSSRTLIANLFDSRVEGS